MNSTNIQTMIENYRNLMILAAELFGFTAEITVKISQKLDQLLNIVQKNSVSTI